MVEAVPFGVAANLLTNLASSAFSDICLACGLENERRKLEDTLSTIEAALLDADQKQEKSNLVKNWIAKLNRVVYDADDVLDEIATKALQQEQCASTTRRIRAEIYILTGSIKNVWKIACQSAILAVLFCGAH